jgi:hypothetical protein
VVSGDVCGALQHGEDKRVRMEQTVDDGELGRVELTKRGRRRRRRLRHRRGRRLSGRRQQT